MAAAYFPKPSPAADHVDDAGLDIRGFEAAPEPERVRKAPKEPADGAVLAGESEQLRERAGPGQPGVE